MLRIRYIIPLLGIALCAAGLMLRPLHFARAQTESAAAQEGGLEAETPEDATRFFLEYLHGKQQTYPFEDVLSAKDLAFFEGRTKLLMQTMRALLQGEQWTLEVRPAATGSSKVVIISPGTAKPREVICVEEPGGAETVWRVDAVETYKRWTGLSQSDAALKLLGATGALLPGLPRDEQYNRSICQTQLRHLAQSMAMYSQDYDEFLPPARTWMAATAPYLRWANSFTCPTVAKNGYAMNINLSSGNIWFDSNTVKTVLLYDTTRAIPNAFGVGQDVSSRHQGGANYAYPDGHVKWLAKSTRPQFHLKRGR